MAATENEQVTESKPGPGIKKLSRRFNFSVSLLLILAMCVFWLISGYNTRNLLQQQADSMGQTLAQQTSIQLTELVLANDLISMNVVLSGLVRDSAIAEIAVLDIDGNVIASANGQLEPLQPLLPIPLPLDTVPAEYQSPISLPDSVIGFVSLQLNLDYIEVGAINNLLLIVGATLLLVVVAVAMTSTYFQYLVSFPSSLLSHALSNVRKGDIDTCPEPDDYNEISQIIRQYNATAEFLAQNAFLDNFGNRRPEDDVQHLHFVPGQQDVSLLLISMANFQYLASTLQPEAFVKLLNRFYFFVDKVSQLYTGKVSYCAEGEVIINFADAPLEEDQAFFAICAGQLFLHIVGDINDVDGLAAPSKYKLAVHSGQQVSSLYSPITGTSNNLTGKTLDEARAICNECPDNSLLISKSSYEHAGAHSRVDADEFSALGEDELIRTYLGREPLSDFMLLLERQAIQLVTLYAD